MICRIKTIADRGCVLLSAAKTRHMHADGQLSVPSINEHGCELIVIVSTLKNVYKGLPVQEQIPIGREKGVL